MLASPVDRHVVEALVGPAQRMRRDDDVVHREQRIIGVDRLLLEHVERRTRDAPRRSASISAASSTIGPRATLMKYAVGFILRELRRADQVPRRRIERQQTTT